MLRRATRRLSRGWLAAVLGASALLVLLIYASSFVFSCGLDRASQDHAAAVTRQLVDAAIQQGGTYYLTYQLYPTAEQLNRAYPTARAAFERKRFYDPDETFSNQFYDFYGRNRAR